MLPLRKKFQVLDLGRFGAEEYWAVSHPYAPAPPKPKFSVISPSLLNIPSANSSPSTLRPEWNPHKKFLDSSCNFTSSTTSSTTKSIGPKVPFPPLVLSSYFAYVRPQLTHTVPTLCVHERPPPLLFVITGVLVLSHSPRHRNFPQIAIIV